MCASLQTRVAVLQTWGGGHGLDFTTEQVRLGPGVRGGAHPAEVQRVAQHGVHPAEDVRVAAGGESRGVRVRGVGPVAGVVSLQEESQSQEGHFIKTLVEGAKS